MLEERLARCHGDILSGLKRKQTHQNDIKQQIRRTSDINVVDVDIELLHGSSRSKLHFLSGSLRFRCRVQKVQFRIELL